MPRIRAGFVANSSSTSFILLSPDDLTERNFLELMGLTEGSPLNSVFRELFRLILGKSQVVDLRSLPADVRLSEVFSESSLSDEMLKRLEEGRERGLKAYVGRLASDDGSVLEAHFCTDHFEVEREGVYLNYLECVW